MLNNYTGIMTENTKKNQDHAEISDRWRTSKSALDSGLNYLAVSTGEVVYFGK
jgi:hypothetical protein